MALWSISLLTFGIDIPKKVVKSDNKNFYNNSNNNGNENTAKTNSKYIELDMVGSEKSKDRLNKLLDGRFMSPEILSVTLSLFLVGATCKV